MIGRKELRARAKETLKGNYGKSLGVTFVTGLLNVGGIFTMGPIAYGVDNYFVAQQRGENPTMKDAFSGFSKYGKTFGAPIRKGLLIALWTAIPFAGWVIGPFVKPQAYALMNQIMKDDDVRSKAAITKSKELMKGYKKRLFGLRLHWTILSCLTLGLGFLFFAPYLKAGEAELYAEILNNLPKNETEAPAAQ